MFYIPIKSYPSIFPNTIGGDSVLILLNLSCNLYTSLEKIDEASRGSFRLTICFIPFSCSSMTQHYLIMQFSFGIISLFLGSLYIIL